MSFVGVQSHQQVDTRRYTWSPPEKRGSPGVTPCPRRACCSRATSPSSTRRPATAAPPRARRPASPTASSTTGPAPVWSSPPCAGAAAPAPSGSTASATSSCSRSSSDCSTPASRSSRSAARSPYLRERGVDDLAQITLMSDGASVYECTSSDEVIDLLQGGQGVFGIAVGRVWREVEGELAAAAQRARRARGRRDARSPATSSAPAAPRAWPDPPLARPAHRGRARW